MLRPGGFLICSLTNGSYGFAVNLLRQVLGRSTVLLFWRWQKAPLFRGFEILLVRDSFLPLQRLLALLGRQTEKFMHGCVSRKILRAFCFEQFFLLRKWS